MEQEYRIEYKCFDCGNEWEEIYSCPCDSECGICGRRDINPTNYEILDGLVNEKDVKDE